MQVEVDVKSMQAIIDGHGLSGLEIKQKIIPHNKGTTCTLSKLTSFNVPKAVHQ